MSDENGDETVTVTEPETIEGEGAFDVIACLKKVLKDALLHDGLARGLREAAKALDRRQAHLCVLAGNCEAPEYTRLIEALCDEHDIKLIKVPDSKQLGEWAGLCKIDKEGNARKVVACVCVVVTAIESTQELDQLLNYVKTRGNTL